MQALMPRKAPTPCRHNGCRELVTPPGFCKAHQTVKYTQARASRSAEKVEHDRFYARVAWRNVRALQLSIEPLCRECRKRGRLVQATVVDHILARNHGGSEYELDNLQSMCKSCHDSKTAREQSRTVVLVG